jgi:hypothetical protein
MRKSSPFQKNDAISLLQSLSFNGSPLISSTRLQRLQRNVASLREHEALYSRQARTQQDVDWINRVLRDGILAAELEGQYCDPARSKELIARLRGSKSVRNRAMAILAHLRGVSDHTIATALGMSRPHYSALPSNLRVGRRGRAIHTDGPTGAQDQ